MTARQPITKNQNRRASDLQPHRQLLRQRSSSAESLNPTRRQSSQTPQLLEASTILGVNLLLSIAAIVSLCQLIPYQLAQVQKLKEMRAEVSRTENRVNRLKSQLHQNLDPKQTSRIVEEQSNLIEVQQMKVVWVKPQADASSGSQSNPVR